MRWEASDLVLGLPYNFLTNVFWLLDLLIGLQAVLNFFILSFIDSRYESIDDFHQQLGVLTQV